MSFKHTLAIALAISALLGCRENGIAKEPNDPPIARARVVNAAGETVDKKAPADMRTFALDGAQAVEVTLVGDDSIDDDGEIVGYRWLSGTGTPLDGGGIVPGSRLMPEGEEAGWPEDTARPKVMLPEGSWTFTLWVEDDDGVVSAPDTITVEVTLAGADAAPTDLSPEVAACVDTVVEAVSRACAACMCEIESCRPLVVETGCDGTCWDLIQCIGANCPDFQAMAAMMDYSCLTMNCMAEYTASMGGGTPAGATPAGGCARMCPDECASM